MGASWFKFAKTIVACIAILSLILGGCTDTPQANISASALNDPKQQMLNDLFLKIMGRNRGSNEVIKATDQPTLTIDKVLSSRTVDGETIAKQTFYAALVPLLLDSQQFIDDGFIHLHNKRLLLTSNSAHKPAYEYEMRAVAATDHYWDLFTYTDRYLPLPSVAALNCGQYLDPANEHRAIYACDCKKEIQQLIYCKSDFLEEYHTQCEPSNNSKLCNYYRSRKPADYQCSSHEDSGESNECQVEANDLIYFFISLSMSEHYLAGKHGSRDDYQIATKPETVEVKKQDDGLFIKAKMPADLQGIHASPLWLSSHRTSKSNQALHRARILLHSWFCADVSPDAAQKSNATPTKVELDEFKSYFAAGDQHTKGDSNCFNCHKQVQPLANYFGRLSTGNFGVLSLLLYETDPDISFDRRAGYYSHATLTAALVTTVMQPKSSISMVMTKDSAAWSVLLNF
ncbi:MAG: DUF1588 domain-containing protein [Pseudomonadota bacterium]|nr:DUF1588 domain-containing protein [Pseudomonadota bacterium]